jgi:hypothetical protein
MRQHVLGMYDSVQVKHSYLLHSQYFDCVPLTQQPSVRALGPQSIAAPPPHLPSLTTQDSADGALGRVQPATQVDPQQKVDRFGNSIGCEPGTIPMRRITLDELSRFRSLQQYFRKSPDGTDDQRFHRGAISPAAVTHKYAHASQSVINYGGSSGLNLWRPFVNTSKAQVFSLSQHWYINFGSGKTQTVEGGWQNFPQKYGSQNSALFIYWTADGYSKTGCYNLDCRAFVQVNNTIRLGSGFANYSVYGGAQYEVLLSWYLYQGNWWLRIGSTWVGYYPGTLWGNANLARFASVIDYGGETVGSTSWPPMGSGRFASTGGTHAAFQRLIQFYQSSAGALANATLTGQQPSPRCYTLLLRNNSNTAYKTYFYFGGPGGTAC